MKPTYGMGRVDNGWQEEGRRPLVRQLGIAQCAEGRAGRGLAGWQLAEVVGSMPLAAMHGGDASGLRPARPLDMSWAGS